MATVTPPNRSCHLICPLDILQALVSFECGNDPLDQPWVFAENGCKAYSDMGSQRGGLQSPEYSDVHQGVQPISPGFDYFFQGLAIGVAIDLRAVA